VQVDYIHIAESHDILLHIGGDFLSKYTPQQAKWTRDYINSMGEIKIRPPKQDKARYQAIADGLGVSLNKFIIEAIEEKIARDQK
jgi:predicted HicB family RNase H-like nuclease